MASKTFTAQSTKHLPLISFDIADDTGTVVGSFRATPKPRLDVAQMLATAVQLQEGNRIFNLDIIATAIREMLVTRVWSDEANAWLPADDRDRFNQLLVSDEYAIPIEQLGAICMWLMEETTGHPTGAPNPS